MTSYRQRVGEIERRLEGCRLIFFGTRGTDSRSLLDLNGFADVFSQIAPLDAPSIHEICLESLTGERVDLDSYSIDLDPSAAVHDLRKGLLRAFSRPAAVLPYRPSAVLAAACFPRANLVRYMGVFHEKQACFEHKPWIETQLAAAGIRVLPWAYFADDDRILIREAAEAGPLVLRANRSDGGAGLTLIEDPAQLEAGWPVHGDGFLAAAPYLAPSLPLNVNACVFPGGEVALHSPSLQLIGVPSCTGRRFGYCGNDFARIAELEPRQLDELESMTRTAGRWLERQGYIGAFGIDALLHDGDIYLIEVNPRFQGSSAVAAELARDLDRPDIFLDHIAAFLGLPPPSQMPLCELARMQPATAHVVCHNLLDRPVRAALASPDDLVARCSLLPAPGTIVQPHAALFALRYHHAVTDTGQTLVTAVEEHLAVIARVVSGAAPLETSEARPVRPRVEPL
jgi:ATP-grasp domain